MGEVDVLGCPGVWLARGVPTAVAVEPPQDLLDRESRKLPLRNEANSRAFPDELREVVLRLRRDEDHIQVSGVVIACQLPDELESTVLAQADIHQYQIWSEQLRP